jgi:hypothetical protein
VIEMVLFERLVTDAHERSHQCLGHKIGLDLEARRNEIAGKTAAEHISNSALGLVEPVQKVGDPTRVQRPEHEERGLATKRAGRDEVSSEPSRFVSIKRGSPVHGPTREWLHPTLFGGQRRNREGTVATGHSGCGASCLVAPLNAPIGSKFVKQFGGASELIRHTVMEVAATPPRLAAPVEVGIDLAGLVQEEGSPHS